MATRQRFESDTRGDGEPGAAQGQSLAGLVRDLAQDTTLLVRQELQLAKLEIASTMRGMVRDTIYIGVALGLAAIGGLALVVAMILGIGALLGAYWAGALITGLLFLAIGGVLARRALTDFQNLDMKPTATLESLRQDKELAAGKAQRLKRELTR